MKFVLLVEGQTEAQALARFFKRWLDPHFAVGIGIKTVQFDGWSELRDEAPKRVVQFLGAPDGNDTIAVISLLDLYGPTFYPDASLSVEDRYHAGVDYMTKRVIKQLKETGKPDEWALRYRHFFAVHETEAWLLTKPSLFPGKISEALEKYQAAPETVNNQNPPCKLLERLYLKEQNRRYIKPVNARNFFPKLPVEDAMAKCPYLEQMLLELREMGRDAGVTTKLEW